MERNTDLEAIVFDFDGTLFDLDLDLNTLKAELETLVGHRLPIAESLALLDPPQAREFEERLTTTEIAAAAAGNTIPCTREVLNDLVETFRLAVVSRNSRASIEIGLERLGVDIPVVGREDVKRMKPDPEGLLRAMALLQVEPSRTAMVGDTFHDVEVARAAGVRSIVVANARLTYAPEGADVYLDSIDELSELLLDG